MTRPSAKILVIAKPVQQTITVLFGVSPLSTRPTMLVIPDSCVMVVPSDLSPLTKQLVTFAQLVLIATRLVFTTARRVSSASSKVPMKVRRVKIARKVSIALVETRVLCLVQLVISVLKEQETLNKTFSNLNLGITTSQIRRPK